MTFVLDASVTLAWCFNDEQSPYTLNILSTLKESSCLVPILWRVEVINVLQIGIKRKRITEAEIKKFFVLLDQLDIQTDNTQHNFYTFYDFAQKYELTSYDATYLHLAKTKGLPLATLDKQLIQAAKRARVELYNGVGYGI